ncbi:MAG: ABC transporter ATP-binding protein [Brooklawnia sp.]|jgi:ABC-type dipeptide/oligopeptide/nickel transport system ATPase subunit
MSLTARDVSFRYRRGGPLIVDGFSCELNPGETLALIAPSGAGKTTICQLLTGYLTPQHGEVLVDGEPLPETGHCPVQMVWQQPERAVNPLMRLAATLAEGGPVERRVLAELGIEDAWLSRYPQELSAGEIQRICLARALGPNTRYLIADEITTMLDPISQAAIWHFLLTWTSRRNIGLLLVTHDEVLAQRVGMRRIPLHG